MNGKKRIFMKSQWELICEKNDDYDDDGKRADRCICIFFSR